MTGITVGIPVYNNGATLRRTVESVLAQTLRPNIIHISDNASTDETREVAEALAAEHAIIRYTRQPTGLGSSGNFRFLLEQARTPCFMWLAADDYILPRFLAETSSRLDADPGLVTCICQVQFTVAGEPTDLATGGRPLMDASPRNLARYLNHPGANVRIYGLHRTDIMRKSFPPRHFHAFDWAAMAGMLKYGNHDEIPEILMVRDETPSSAYVMQVRADNPTFLTRFFPLLPMTLDLLWRQRIPIDRNVLSALLRINLELHTTQSARFNPKYHRLVGRHVAKQFWRFDPSARLDATRAGAAGTGVPQNNARSAQTVTPAGLP